MADWEDLLAIADRLEARVRRQFLEAMARVQRTVPARRLADALASGRSFTSEIADALGASISHELSEALDTIDEAFRLSGQLAAVQLRQPGIRFNVTNPFAVTAAQANAARLVREITFETQAAIRSIVTRAFTDQLSRVEASRLIRPLIGLTRTQALAALNYRQALIDNGLRGAALDRRTREYVDRKLRERARTIARTELMRASNAGQRALWEAMRANGTLRNSTGRKWSVTPDDRLAIVGGGARVLTVNGWKRISQIRAGDRVATHADHFHRVMRAEGKWYEGSTVRLQVGSRAIRSLHVTYGHPILVNRDGSDQWVDAEYVVETDKLYANSVPCARCGRHVLAGPWYPKAMLPICHSCNVAKTNSDPRLNADRSAAMTALNKERWARPGERELAAERWRGDKSPVHAGLRARARNNYNGMSWPERKMSWWLRTNGIAHEQQWRFRYGESESRRGFADFYITGAGIVIECDGPTHRNDPSVAQRDVMKDAHLTAQGIRVMRFTDTAIRNDFASVASTIRAQCCLVTVPIKRISHQTIRHQPVYHITVEGDASYVVNGIVVHNCPRCQSLRGQVRGFGEEFVAPLDGSHVLEPPLHPSCRCVLMLVLDRKARTA